MAVLVPYGFDEDDGDDDGDDDGERANRSTKKFKDAEFVCC
jgi:hypothetical protein